MNLNDLFTEEKVRLDPKCWTGKKIGNPKTKMKGGTRVNNCVPAESVNEMDKSQTPPGRDGSNDSDAGKKEYTAKATTPEKVAKDAEKILNKELNKKQGVAEGFGDVVKGIKRKVAGKEDPKDVEHTYGRIARSAIKHKTPDQAEKDIKRWEKVNKVVKKQGVAEGTNDTIYPNAEVIKSKNGKPVGEIYQDGNSWGAFHYKADRGYDFIDSREEAIEALKDLHQETGRSRPDYTIKGVAEGSDRIAANKQDRLDALENKLIAKGYTRTKDPDRREYQYKWTKDGAPTYVVNYRFGSNGYAEFWKEQGVAEDTGPEKKMTVDQALEIAKKNNSSFTAKDYYDLIIRNEGLDSSFFNSEVMSAIQKKQGVAEADDSNFVGFMNKTLADKVDSPKADPMAGAPDFYRNAAVSTLDGRQGFKNALKFGLKALSRLDPETRQQLAAGSEQAVANYLTDVAERSGQMGDDTFVEEDISEVQDYLSDVFHDPSINSWKDVLQQSRIMSESQLDEKSVSQAQFRTMAAAAHNPEFAKKVGISQDVAQEFHGADRKQEYKKLPDRTTEGEQQKGADYRDPPEADYGDDYQDMVARMKKLAGLGPLKTVYDPAKRVYRNMPTAQQPKK